MAVDLRIELFAYDLFQAMWYKHKLIPVKKGVSEQYSEERLRRDPEYEEVFNDCHLQAVLFFRSLFQSVYTAEILQHHKDFIDSPSDMYDYLLRIFTRRNHFSGLKIFECVFATCAFVAEMCVFCYRKGLTEIIHYAHGYWAMYFQQCRDKFYDCGGWQKLHQEALSYIFPIQFYNLNCVNPALNSSFKVNLAVTNHFRFHYSVRTDDCHTSAKKWVNIHHQVFMNLGSSCTRPRKNFSLAPNAKRDRKLLRLLMTFCDLGKNELHTYEDVLLALTKYALQRLDEDSTEDTEHINDDSDDETETPHDQPVSDPHTKSPVTQNLPATSLELEEKSVWDVDVPRDSNSTKMDSDFSKLGPRPKVVARILPVACASNSTRMDLDVSKLKAESKLAARFSSVSLDSISNTMDSDSSKYEARVKVAASYPPQNQSDQTAQGETPGRGRSKEIRLPQYEIADIDVTRLILVLGDKGANELMRNYLSEQKAKC